jgi:hypothetical protein
MRFLPILCSPLLMALVLGGQNLTMQPDVATAEAAYRDAEEAWLRSDPNLEKDLFNLNPEEARRRIKRNGLLREDVMVKKQGYLDLLIQRTEQMRSRLIESEGGMIPAEAVKKYLEQQQSQILADQDRLEQLIRDLPSGDEYLLVRRPLEDERTRLVNLANTVAQRIRSLDSLDKAQQAIEGASEGDPLEQKLESVLQMWREERAANIRQRSGWAAYYAAMDRAVASQPAGSPAKGRGKMSASAPAPSPAPVAQKPGKWLGLWTYHSQPGAWTGYGEPGRATLELHNESGVLRGTYAAQLPVKGGTHNVQLAVEAIRVSATALTLHWKSTTPVAEGEMELKLSPDRRLLLERSRSGDSYIPLGSEVLLFK